MIHNEDGCVEPVGGRMPIVMACADDEPGVDCLALAPVGMSLAEARIEFGKAFVKAVRADGESIQDYLEAVGFTFHDVAMWYEQEDGYDEWGDGQDDLDDESDDDDDSEEEPDDEGLLHF
jgi:hypothetical protein